MCIGISCVHSLSLFPLLPPFFLSFNYSLNKIKLLSYILLGTVWGIGGRVEKREDGIDHDVYDDESDII